MALAGQTSGFVIDTPQAIQVYRYMATMRGLEMEIKMQAKYGCAPTALPTRGMALRSAQRILKSHNVPQPRTRKACHKALTTLYLELGLISKEST